MSIDKDIGVGVPSMPTRTVSIDQVSFSNISRHVERESTTMPVDEDFTIPSGLATATSSNIVSNNIAESINKKNAAFLKAATVQIETQGLDNVPELKSSYQYTGKVDDIDEKTKDDPLAVSEYAEEMYEHFRKQEAQNYVRPTYLSLQPEITNEMRSVLVDWLVSVQHDYRLSPETLYLTVNIVDRFLEVEAVPRSQLQLVGATALFIASKYEEIYAPQAHEIVHICDNTYQKEELIRMETFILRALGYKISLPTAHTFLVRYLKAGHADEQISQIACYVLEHSLTSYELLQFLPSELAAASVLIARCSAYRNPWSATLLTYANYLEEEVTPVARAILEHRVCASPDLTAVNNKYGSRYYGRVSGLVLWCE